MSVAAVKSFDGNLPPFDCSGAKITFSNSPWILARWHAAREL
jgi:hypothetical protein